MTFDEIHARAMELVDQARASERVGDGIRSVQLLRDAYKTEEQAARTLCAEPDSEPTRTVLFRSAASIAFQAEDYREACALAYDGLTGNSPDEFAAELLEIASDACGRLRLIAQNLRVPNNEITLTLRGPRVSVGIAPAKQATTIFRRIEMLLRGVVEEFLAGSHQGHAKLYDVFMRPVHEGEFSVAFRLGLTDQIPLFDSISVSKSVTEKFMPDLQSAVKNSQTKNAGDPSAIKFSTAVRKLVPDGKEVTSIEVSSIIDGQTLCVRIPPGIRPSREVAEVSREKLSIG